MKKGIKERIVVIATRKRASCTTIRIFLLFFHQYGTQWECSIIIMVPEDHRRVRQRQDRKLSHILEKWLRWQVTVKWSNCSKGFCAIIHHFYPETLDYAALSPSNLLRNNELGNHLTFWRCFNFLSLWNSSQIRYTKAIGCRRHVNGQARGMTLEVPPSHPFQQFSIITYLSAYYNRFMKGDAKGRGGGVLAIKESPNTARARPGWVLLLLYYHCSLSNSTIGGIQPQWQAKISHVEHYPRQIVPSVLSH